GVEGPIGHAHPVMLQNENRPVITAPDIVGRDVPQPDVVPDRLGLPQLRADAHMRLLVGIDVNALETARRGGYFGEFFGDGFVLVRPDMFGNGPREPQGVLWFPFGGHTASSHSK